MDKAALYTLAGDFAEHSAFNRVPGEKALAPGLAGMRMFGRPLLGFCAADDEYLLGLAGNPAANVPLEPPDFWLPGAKTVLSFFLPMPEAVRAGNRADMSWPSLGWMQVRIDGQPFIARLGLHLAAAIEAAGYRAVIPSSDGRFWSQTAPVETGPAFTSNWSERHVAYACGLGTFSLSKGLITKKGVAGRFGSLVTDLPLPPDERPYTGLYDYCTRCGACARNCPAGAITKEGGKEHPPCGDFIERVRSVNPPYYGCGKCQVAVPCEARAPV